MQKFNFTMESVLKYRESIEDIKKEQLANSINKTHTEKELLQDLLGKKSKYSSSPNSGNVNVTMLQHNEAFHSLLNFQIEMQMKKISELQNLVKKHRVQLAEAAKSRKTMENLKEKRFDEYQKILTQEEQKALDEAGIAAYCRKAE